MAKWTKKLEHFCERFVVHGNGTRAAIEAGYSKKTATEMAYENLRKPHVSEKIKELRKKLSDESMIDAFWVLQQASKLHDRCMQEEPVRDREGNEIGEYKFDSAGAARALDIVAKHIDVGAYKEKLELSGSVDTKTIIQVTPLISKND